MNLIELEDHVSVLLRHLRVSTTKMSVLRNMTTEFMVNDFGIVVCCLNRADYTQVSNAVVDKFKDWRIFYVTTSDNLIEKKYELVWALMRCGYMKWLRYTFPMQVKNILNGPDNLGMKIITERLRLWANKPKYKFLIEDNQVAFKNGILRELTNDPSFFDFMPEEE